MRNYVIFVAGLLIQATYGHYQGPFLMWGVENLNDMKIPTLQAIDDQNLRDIYTKASAIVIFIRNATTKLSYENFPELSEIIGKNEWLYLPQEYLTSDPLEYNVNAEVFTLTGAAVMQDNEIAAFYRDAQINYGNKNVLGILAARSENPEHLILKREAKLTTEASTSEPPTSSANPDVTVTNLVYISESKGSIGMLYTTVTPVLYIPHENQTIMKHELHDHAIVTADERPGMFRLIVRFIISDGTINIRFIFNISDASWTLTHAEYENPLTSTSFTMEVVGAPPAAPLGFSYACSKSTVFKKDKYNLTLSSFQVQPLLDERKFKRAYDCVGFMTAPILAGTFVVSILFIVLSIAITAIMDIKPPNKFENRSSKQLTFTVQE